MVEPMAKPIAISEAERVCPAGTFARREEGHAEGGGWEGESETDVALRMANARLQAECDQLRQLLRAIPEGAQFAAGKWTEFQNAILVIRRARDSAQAEALEAGHRLQEMAGENEQLAVDCQVLQHRNDALQAEVATLDAELRQTRDLLKGKEEAHAATAAKLTEQVVPLDTSAALRLNAELHAANARAESFREHLHRLQQDQKQSNAALLKQLYTAERDRDLAAEGILASRAEVATLRERLEKAEERAAKAETELGYLVAATARRAEERGAAEELEHQRQQIAELTAELNAARDELRFAWALTDRGNGPESTVGEVVEASAAGECAEATLHSPIEGSAARLVLSEMSETLVKCRESFDRAAMLRLLVDQLSQYGQRALATGSMTACRVAEVCVEVARVIERTPDKLETIGGRLEEALRVLGDLAECNAAGIHPETEDATVYLLDDDMDNCECIAMALQKYGARTHYATNPRLALEHLGAERCDLILLDVDLGGVTGFEVQAQLRMIPHHRQTPILFVSGLSSAEAKVKALASEADAFLAKPYTLSVLGLKALQMIVQSRIARGH